MTTILEPTPPPAAPTAPTVPPSRFRPYLLSVDQYQRMIAAGVFDEDEPVYLWNGWLVEKMPKGRRHSRAEKKLYDALLRLVPDAWHVLQEQPILLSDRSQPEPDVAVVRGALDDYPDQAPTARDLSLVIEIADTSLARDLGDTLATYAREAIPIYWLLNLIQRRLEVYRRPEGGRYAEQQVFGPDDEAPLVLDGREVGRVAVRAFLP